MLTVLRTLLPSAFMPDTARGCGRADVGAGVVGGRKVVEGARIALFGVFGLDLPEGVGRPPVLFRVFVTGSAGKAMVGGPFDGRDGRGSVVAMMVVGWLGSGWVFDAGSRGARYIAPETVAGLGRGDRSCHQPSTHVRR